MDSGCAYLDHQHTPRFNTTAWKTPTLFQMPPIFFAYAGYSSYKAYVHYKGTRGSWRMQHLIKDYERRSGGSQSSVGGRPAGADYEQRSGSLSSVCGQPAAGADYEQRSGSLSSVGGRPAGAIDAPAKGQINGALQRVSQWSSERREVGLGSSSGSGSSSVNLGGSSSSGSPALVASPPHGSGPGGKALCPLGGNLLVEGGGHSADGCSSGPSGLVPKACNEGVRDSHALFPGRRSSSSGGSATGCVPEEEGDPLLCEEGRAQQQRSTEQAVQGLEYRLLPLLSPFVALLLAGPADVLPEEAAHELCLLLPQQHRAEVAQHIAELRRRHERQRQRALPRPPATVAGRQQPGKKMQEMADIMPPRIPAPVKEARLVKEAAAGLADEGEVHAGLAGCWVEAGENETFLDPLSR